jgi:hypothetical protein
MVNGLSLEAATTIANDQLKDNKKKIRDNVVENLLQHNRQEESRRKEELSQAVKKQK